MIKALALALCSALLCYLFAETGNVWFVFSQAAFLLGAIYYFIVGVNDL